MEERQKFQEEFSLKIIFVKSAYILTISRHTRQNFANRSFHKYTSN